MAIYYARKSGNVNATDVWATTPSGAAGDFFPSFTSSDTLMANSFTITLNVNTTVLEVRTDTTGGATGGGGFTLNSGVTLNANVYAGTTTCVTFSSTSPSSSIINGNLFGSSSSTYAVINNNTGSLTVNGNVTSGSSSYGHGAGNVGGILNIVGNVSAVNGSSNTNSTAVLNGAGTINITGNVTAGLGGSAFGASNGIGIINVIGNVYGYNCPYANTPAINNANSGTVNITGIVIGGGVNVNNTGITNAGNGTVNITGTVIGGITTSCHGAANNSTGTINIIGTAIGGINIPGVNNSSTGTVIITRAKGNGFGPGSVGVSAAVGASNSQTGTMKVYEIEYGDLGQSPTSGPIELVTANSNVAVFAVRFSTKKTLVDLNNATNLVPASGNVRSGVSYNYGNDTGSCIIPNANSVVYGVPVDNTVGSGLLSPVAVWNALTSAIGTSGSIGERLKNCSTIATVGKQLEGVL